MKKLIGFFVLLFSVVSSLRLLLKRWVRYWTAEEPEKAQKLAGDDIIENPAMEMTNAVTIKAPPEYVWQWLVQMGADRAGWYSYDKLDNGGLPSADAIVPEFQDLDVGDVVKALPESEGGFRVVKLVKPLELVYTTFTKIPFKQSKDQPQQPTEYYWRTSWAFVLTQPVDNVTRLLVRARIAYKIPEGIAPIARVLAYPVHFVMQQRQLYNIRQRAESFYEKETMLKQAVAPT